jgi:hypothetical protein
LVAGFFPDAGLRLAAEPGAGQFFGERAILTPPNDVDAISLVKCPSVFLE